MKKVYAGYARTSTFGQSSGLEAQVRAIREYCKAKGIEDFVIYQDEGHSGTKNSRPALDTMMRAVQDGQVAGVICFSFSRFARSTTHLLSALAIFKKLGVKFYSITEQLDLESPLGVACFTLTG